jgi:hypothetical protein
MRTTFKHTWCKRLMNNIAICFPQYYCWISMKMFQCITMSFDAKANHAKWIQCNLWPLWWKTDVFL